MQSRPPESLFDRWCDAGRSSARLCSSGGGSDRRRDRRGRLLYRTLRVASGRFWTNHRRKGSNVQDNCTLHSMPGFDCVIGVDGHIGHGAIVHSAQLGPNVLVGMNAVVMDHARIGESAMIGAMSFVKAGAEIPARHLAAGVPARVLRELSADELARKVEATRNLPGTCSPVPGFVAAGRAPRAFRRKPSAGWMPISSLRRGARRRR